MRNSSIFSLIICLTIVAGSAFGQEYDPRSGPIRQLFIDHFEAMEREDIDAVMRTIHPQSPNYNPTRRTLVEMFMHYDLEYEFNIIRISFESEGLAHVYIEQTTRKKAGPAFRDNRVMAVHEIRKFQGSWLIFGTTIENIDYTK